MRLALCALFALATSACAQTPEPRPANEGARPDLYLCEGCEAAEERAPETLASAITLAPEGEPGERLVLTGRVVQPGGTTPAPGVVLYLHQTNADGFYRSIRSQGDGGRRDGMLEGWVVTDADGRYRVATIKPAPYPRGGMPAHIHIYVKEPGRRPYYIDDVVFHGEVHVDADYRAAQELRGGSGIVRLTRDEAGGWLAVREIVLER